MGGGAIDGGVVGGPGVGIEGPIGGDEVGGVLDWQFGDVLRLDPLNVKWEVSGPTRANVEWL